MTTDEADDPEGVLAVYVPRPDTPLREEIVSGSGVVGPAGTTDERLRIDFEGNVHSLPELTTYASRVKRAAERHLWTGPDGERYPTSACAQVERADLIEIGRFDLLALELEIDDRDALADWLGVEAVPEGELDLSRDR